MRRRHTIQKIEWDGVARYHDGTPVEKIKRYLEQDMNVFDHHLPKEVRDFLNEKGGVATEYRPPMTGMRWTGSGWQ